MALRPSCREHVTALTGEQRSDNGQLTERSFSALPAPRLTLPDFPFPEGEAAAPMNLGGRELKPVVVPMSEIYEVYENSDRYLLRR